ncbi:MAG: ABC transporter permease [Chloroflexota bacterium]
MVPLLLRRLVFLIAVLCVVTALTFALSHLTGTDPAQLLAGPRATPVQLANLRQRYGLDRPLPVQYLLYLHALAQGDLGVSTHTQRAVSADLRQFLPATLELVGAALGSAVVLGVTLGALAAVSRALSRKAAARLVSLAGLAVPVFWLGLLAQWLLYDVVGWLPSAGRLDMALAPPPHVTGFYLVDSLLAARLDLFLNAARHLVLPAVVLGYGVMASITRMMRASLLEVLRADYIRTARAKGLSRRAVVVRHALRNASLATLTTIGLQFGGLLGSTILVETVFSWPGLGLYLQQSVAAADYSPILGVTLAIAALYVLSNLAVDVGYLAADPRIRYG